MAQSTRGLSGLTDYHTHPERMRVGLDEKAQEAHFLDSMRQYARRAAELGLAELGFSEHIYRLSIAPGAVPWRTDGTIRGDIGAYVRAVETVRAETQGVAIRLSMEVDIVPATVSILQAALPLYPFDYLLGSVHEIPDLDEQPSTRTAGAEGVRGIGGGGAGPEDSYRAYYGAMRWAAKSGLFHSIAHPDRIHRKLEPIPANRLEPLMAEAAEALAQAGLCVELSANGVRRGIIGTDPNHTFVRLCFEHGVGITFGSDAHRLEDVGTGLGELRDLAWQAGYRDFATFERGKRVNRPLPAPLGGATPAALASPAAPAGAGETRS